MTSDSKSPEADITPPAPLNVTITVREQPDQILAATSGLVGVDELSGAGTYRPIVQVERTQPNPQFFQQPLGYTNGLSTLFALSGSGFQGRFHQGLPDQAGWQVRCLAHPALDLGGIILGLEQLGEDVFVRLFGDSPAEPYRTWKMLWYSQAPLPYRLGAVLLALAARTDELRKGT